MRLTTSSALIILPCAVLASQNVDSSLALQTSAPSQQQEEAFATKDAYILTMKPSYPQPTSYSSPPSADDSSTQFNNLELRQAIGAAGGPVTVVPSPTQQSPITTYLVRGPNGQQTPVPYTQTFVAIPDQWPGPSSGAIGLGTIQGQIGVVKSTNAKRDAAPTVVPRGGGSVLRSVEQFVKRKTPSSHSGSSGSNSNDAGTTSVPMLAAIAGLSVGVIMSFL